MSSQFKIAHYKRAFILDAGGFFEGIKILS